VRFSVVIVNWNSRGDLRACLSSLRSQTYRNLEIIVVDNGSADGSADVVSAEFAECVLIRERENLGFAEGCNRGIDAATGAWVVMLNNDCVADPDWARALVAASERARPSCGMLQSLMLFQDRPDTINSTGIELTAHGGGRDRDRDRPRNSNGPSGQAIFCPTAGAGAYRRAMLDAIRLSSGYFDREYFMYLEDLDLGWRARLAGWTAEYVSDSVVHHKWHGSVDRHGRDWLTAAVRINRIRTLVKNASTGFLARTIAAHQSEVVELVKDGRLAAARRLGHAVRRSLAQRREVSAIARVDRRAVERAWVVE
jgi:GT2 family glycosyltransferase